MRNNIYSVSQVNKYIKNMFRNDFMLNNLEIRGEISNLKYHSSGHIYFTLKDETSAIKCVMFSSYTNTLKFRMQEGMQVIVAGTADVFERDGSYQIYAKSIKQDGVGNLFEEFEKLKEKLKEQGMFEAEFKRPIPKFVKTLGVVTAPTGAAVRDIIDVSKRRNPGIQIILYPAIVQGAEAPKSIIQGINELNQYGVDVIICGRGGGSIEDLWGFNDEGVANAIFNSEAPVISAVGHETDFTIADFVSDLRAPTPSAAAELAVFNIADLIRQLSNKQELLNKDIEHILIYYRNEILSKEKRISSLDPRVKLEKQKMLLSNCSLALERRMADLIKEKKHYLELSAGRLNGLSPLTKLSSGYSYVEGKDGKAVKSIKTVNSGDDLKINVTDGFINAKVLNTEALDV